SWPGTEGGRRETGWVGGGCGRGSTPASGDPGGSVGSTARPRLAIHWVGCWAVSLRVNSVTVHNGGVSGPGLLHGSTGAPLTEKKRTPTSGGVVTVENGVAGSRSSSPVTLGSTAKGPDSWKTTSTWQSAPG